MYHGTPETTEKRFDVAAASFFRQIERVAAAGMAGRSLEAQVADQRASAVAITFDDAEQSNFEHAFPILQRAQMSATFFVVTDWVGTTGYCSWPELRTMSDAGMSIQSHTVSHPFLSLLSPDAALREMRVSREEIEQRIGVQVTTLALPNGDWPRRGQRQALEDAGYQRVATSRWTPNPIDRSLRSIHRYTVRAATPDIELDDLVHCRSSAWSAEGLRLRALSTLRSRLGVNRYNQIRRSVLQLTDHFRGDTGS